MQTRRVVLGLGSNLGSREATLRLCSERLALIEGVRLCGLAPIWQTKPIGPPQPDYFNTAVEIETLRAPRALLDRVRDLEDELCRTRTVRWGPRTLDIDMLWIDGEVVDEDGLEVPHPELRHRTFALDPLVALRPEAIDPLTGERYASVRARMHLPVTEPFAFQGAFDIEAVSHTADEAFRVTARDRADTLAAAAEALGGLIVNPSSVEARECRVVTTKLTAGDTDDDERLFTWLSEVLFELDARRFALRRAVVLRDEADVVTGQLWGEALDEEIHAVRGAIKAVTMHGLEIGPRDDGMWRAQVTVDV